MNGAWSTTWEPVDACTFAKVDVVGSLSDKGKPDALPDPVLAQRRQQVVEVSEVITCLLPGGVVRTERAISRRDGALVVAPDGDVIVAVTDRVLRIRS